jgi:hypothetical protein
MVRAHSRGRRVTSRITLVGMGAVLAVMAFLPGQRSAEAIEGSCASATQGGTTTTTCFTPGEYLFVVPGGITKVHVIATGASGQSTASAAGGDGSIATTDLVVTPGTQLFLNINNDFGANGVGGGSDTQHDGAPGGGSVDVRTCSSKDSTCAALGSAGDPRIIVGGGGGGAGWVSGAGSAGFGSLSCSPGSNGQTTTANGSGGRGGPCEGTTGGAGGHSGNVDSTVLDGQAGTAGRGGDGGTFSTEGVTSGGGGGGGGYRAGGGGAAGLLGEWADGGGGGGASYIANTVVTGSLTTGPGQPVLAAWHAGVASRLASFATSGSSITAANHVRASVVVSYTAAAVATPTQTPLATPPTGAGGAPGSAWQLPLLIGGLLLVGTAAGLRRREPREAP